jgi:hypothetical protein
MMLADVSSLFGEGYVHCTELKGSSRNGGGGGKGYWRSTFFWMRRVSCPMQYYSAIKHKEE